MVARPGPRCQEAETTPVICDCLLDPRETTLPDHACYWTMRASTENYVRRSLAFSDIAHAAEWPLPDGQRALAWAWPLPVGRRALAAWFRGRIDSALMRTLPREDWPTLGEDKWRRLVEAHLIPTYRDCKLRCDLPFVSDRQRRLLAAFCVEELPPPLTTLPDAEAALVVERHVAGGRVLLLGRLAEDADHNQVLVEPVIITEQHGADDAAPKMAMDLSRWYLRDLLGKRVEGGRPTGATPEQRELIDCARDQREAGASRDTARRAVVALAKRQGWYVEALRAIPATRYERSPCNATYKRLVDRRDRRVRRALDAAYGDDELTATKTSP